MADLPETPSDPWHFLKKATPARIALGRTGEGLPTRRVLEFALAHAQARDAVHRPLDAAALAREVSDLSPILVESRAANRARYLQRPDLGRKLSPAARARLSPGPFDAVIVLADGLSAAAVQIQGAELMRRIRERLPWRFAPPVIATQARVALGDEIAEALGARLAIVLIGERPGLSAADSLGAYITFEPRAGVSRDSDRNCISNIRPAGLPVEEAARRISAVAGLALKLGRSGTWLKEDMALRDAEAQENLPQKAPFSVIKRD